LRPTVSGLSNTGEFAETLHYVFNALLERVKDTIFFTSSTQESLQMPPQDVSAFIRTDVAGFSSTICGNHMAYLLLLYKVGSGRKSVDSR
jgi:hypothetical protein